MAKKDGPNIPRTPAAARRAGGAPVKIVHHDLPRAKKKQWVMFKQASGARGQVVCHYNPNTGNWDDCHEL